MPQGFLVSLGLMAVVGAFALLTSHAPVVAATTAGGMTLCALAVQRLDQVPRLGLYAVAALVPLSYLGSLLAFGGLNSLTKLLFIPAIGVLVLDVTLSRRPWVWGRQAPFALLFALALGISYLVNDATPSSLWFLSRFAGVLLLYVLAANGLRTERDVKWLLAIVAGSCLISALAALMIRPVPGANNMLGDVVRMAGLSNEDAPTFGTNALVALLICLYFLLVAKRGWVRVMLVPAVAGLALTIVQTYARGVSIVLVLSVIYLLFRVRRRVNLVWGLFLLLALGAALVPWIPDTYLERMTSAVTQLATDPTIARRADSYRIGWDVFTRSPLLGFGPGNFIVEYLSPEFRFMRSETPSVCFNLFLSVATQAGLCGLAAFALLIVAAFRDLRAAARADTGSDGFARQAAELLEIILVALLLVSLFEPTDLQKYLWIALGAAAALAQMPKGQSGAGAVVPPRQGP